jgi:hypothetical protein
LNKEHSISVHGGSNLFTFSVGDITQPFYN